MRFLHPELASWLLALPVAFAASYLYAFGKRRFRERAAIGLHLAALSRLSTSMRDRLCAAAALAAITFVTLAVMRPQMLLERRTPEFERADLIIVLDRSASMRARDVAPSRFGRAVHEIRTFLTRKPEGIDRVGLVGFAGTSLIISHLTRDLNSVFFYLDWIQDDTETRLGTDLGAALASARELARKDARPTRKIVLLVSDGDDQGTQLAGEVSALRAEDTRVYTIGIGSDNDVPIPLAGRGRATTYLQDEEGRTVRTRFTEATLRDIALQTGGRYFRSATGGELATAMEHLVDREQRIVGWSVSTEYRDVYRECLFAAAAAMLLVVMTL